MYKFRSKATHGNVLCSHANICYREPCVPRLMYVNLSLQMIHTESFMQIFLGYYNGRRKNGVCVFVCLGRKCGGKGGGEGLRICARRDGGVEETEEDWKEKTGGMAVGKRGRSTKERKVDEGWNGWKVLWILLKGGERESEGKCGGIRAYTRAEKG